MLGGIPFVGIIKQLFASPMNIKALLQELIAGGLLKGTLGENVQRALDNMAGDFDIFLLLGEIINAPDIAAQAKSIVNSINDDTFEFFEEFLGNENYITDFLMKALSFVNVTLTEQ